MRKTIVAISAATFIIVAACSISSGLGFTTVRGSGNVTNETRDVSRFERVDVCCGMELTLTQGDVESLRIEADDNFMDEIVTTVSNGTLTINYRITTNVSYRPSQQVKLYLAAKEIRGVSISGGGELNAESLVGDRFELDLSGGSDAIVGTLTADDVRIHVSGGGNIETESIHADRLEVDLSGSSDAIFEDLQVGTFVLDGSGGGDVRGAGFVETQNIELSGGSSFDGEDLESRETVVSCSGGGNAILWVEETLSANLSGGSSLHYYGHPEILDQNLSGGSDLKSLGDH